MCVCVNKYLLFLGYRFRSEILLPAGENQSEIWDSKVDVFSLKISKKKKNSPIVGEIFPIRSEIFSLTRFTSEFVFLISIFFDFHYRAEICRGAQRHTRTKIEGKWNERWKSEMKHTRGERTLATITKTRRTCAPRTCRSRGGRRHRARIGRAGTARDKQRSSRDKNMRATRARSVQEEFPLYFPRASARQQRTERRRLSIPFIGREKGILASE